VGIQVCNETRLQRFACCGVRLSTACAACLIWLAAYGDDPNAGGDGIATELGGNDQGGIDDDAAADAAGEVSETADNGSETSDGEGCEPTAEKCNGHDDDCDGAVDEDSCEDGNPCTQDHCIDGHECHHTAAATSEIPVPCDDGNACTVGAWCKGMECQLGAQTGCDDDNACTADWCEGKTGCKHAPNNATACDDGDKCTVEDSCNNGACSGKVAADCDDWNPCTKELCDGGLGCQHIALTGPKCDDGDVCTSEDGCKDGKCKPLKGAATGSWATRPASTSTAHPSSATAPCT
jgi:hypothetical protein